MRLRLKTRMAGPDGCYAPGDVVEADGEEAAQLLAGDYAERLPEETPAPVQPDEPADASADAPAKRTKRRG